MLVTAATTCIRANVPADDPVALRTELAERPHEEPPAALRVQHGSEDGRTVETG